MEARSTTSILLRSLSEKNTTEAGLAATSAVDRLGLLMEDREMSFRVTPSSGGRVIWSPASSFLFFPLSASTTADER